LSHGGDARQRGPRGCGATLIGDLVTGVRVTPISGCFVGLGATLGLVYSGARSTVDAAVSGGGGGAAGGGGGGDSVGDPTVAGGPAGAPAGAVGVGDAVCVAGAGRAGVLPGPRKTSSTLETTIAITAAAAATSAVAAAVDRYHGVGAGTKFHVLALNASK
jgi:hypothetical protein